MLTKCRDMEIIHLILFGQNIGIFGLTIVPPPLSVTV